MNLADSRGSASSSVTADEYGVLPVAKNGSGSRLMRILARPERVFPLGRFVYFQITAGLGLSKQQGRFMSKVAKLQVINERAAFVDIGSERHFASIAGAPPEVFGTVTKELHRMRDWLLAGNARSVAMEATSVYWIPVYSALEAAGLEVMMVNGKQTRNLPGRKTDMEDAQWGATLHAHGLLRAGFVPPAHVRRLQDYLRLRGDHLTHASNCIQLQQKALERMNVKLHDVISTLAGASGQRVIEAILAGERDPERLADLCDKSIRDKKRSRVVESLRGTWEEEHLFALRQALESWKHYQKQMEACDREMEKVLRVIAGPRGEEAKPARAAKKTGVNAPEINELHDLLVRWCGGKDLTVLPAHTDYSWLQLLGEVGTDLSKWPTEKHFTAWAGLAPGSHQSGKYNRSVSRKRNRAGRIFCVMARCLARSKNLSLGGFYRRMAARRGGLVANIALARKLALWFWRLMVKGVTYVEQGLAKYEEQVLETKRRTLARLAKQLGQVVLPKDLCAVAAK
jgi:transposase